MHCLIYAFVVYIGYKTRFACRCPYKIASLLPETEISRYLQASLCGFVHLKNRFFVMRLIFSFSKQNLVQL